MHLHESSRAGLSDFQLGVLRAVTVLGLLDSWTGHDEPFSVRTKNDLLLTTDINGQLWAEEAE